MSRKKSPPAALLPAALTVATVGVAAGAAYLARTRKDDVKGFLAARVLEAPAARSSYRELQQALERAGAALAARADRAGDTPGNRETLAHIIGIERWGQERLRAALGERTAPEDTYRPYRPADGATLPELRVQLSETRARTVDLVRQLHLNPPEDTLTVNHNGLGPLTVKAWVRYLTGHADLESRRLRGQPVSAGGEGANLPRVLEAGADSVSAGSVNADAPRH